VPIDHPLAASELLSVADLANENFVCLQRQLYPSHHDKLVSHCEQAGFSPNIVAMSDQTSVLLTYVASGVGVYLAPACARPAWQRHIAFVPMRESMRVDVHMITRHRDNLGSLERLREIAIEVQSAQLSEQAATL
jgi:DNA-binding transcriptional LysR family regulator